ncbi:4941_t:CDS:1, partial [Racocetra fulgida]
MEDYRYRQRQDNPAAKEELFFGATKQYGGEYSQQGGQYPPPGGYQSLPPGGQYPPPGGYGYGYGGNNDPYGQQQQETKNVEEIKSQIRDTKLGSLASTQRSLQMVNDAEV